MTALLGVGVSRDRECVTLADKEAMARGQTERDLLQAGDGRVALLRGSRWVAAAKRCFGLGAAAALWMAMPCVIGCTQNLVATESSSGLGGSSALPCAGQECSGQCCAGFDCKNGRCTAVTDAAYSAGPGQVCNEASGCTSFQGLPYTCESVENTSLCLSPSSIVKNGYKCQVSADCSSLNCVDGICKAGATCGVSGSSCTEHSDCCSNQCGSDRTCTNDDPTCRVVGDTCNPTNPDCCYGNSCSRIGNTYRCVATFGCRGFHDVCGEVGCCMGASCANNRCVEQPSCSARDYPCDDCCSKKCAPDGSKICLALDGCQPIGDKCEYDGDCCSKDCDPKKGRCTATWCGAEGEPCFDRPCCTGDSGKIMACVPDALGVKRCSNQTTCIENRKECAFGSQCCGTARCDYDTSLDAFACTSYCRDLGEYCGRHSDCCGNYCSPLSNTCADGTQY